MLISLLLASLVSYASDLNVPLSTAYSNSQDEISAAICKDGSLYRKCRFTKAAVCQTTTSEAFDECYKADLLNRKTTDVSPADAKEIAKGLLECTTRSAKLRATTALESACYTREARKNPNVKIDTSYLSQYRSIDVPKITATPPPINEVGVERRYDFHVREVVSMYDSLMLKVQAHDLAICPGYRGAAYTGCVDVALRKYPIDIALGFSAAVNILQAGYAFDSKLGPAGAITALNGYVTLFERVEPRKFFLAMLVPKTHADELEIQYETKQENKILDSARTLAKKRFDEGLAGVARMPASESKNQIQKLKSRADKVLSRPYSL